MDKQQGIDANNKSVAKSMHMSGEKLPYVILLTILIPAACVK
jgi:hypothetical protein